MTQKQSEMLDRTANRLYEYGCVPYYEAVTQAKQDIIRLERENERLKEAMAEKQQLVRS